MSSFNLTVLTPFGTYYKGEASYLEVRNEDSVLGILPHHTPIISTVKLGKIKITIKGNKHVYACSGGLLNVKKDGSVTLMVSTIERSDEIDVARAKRSKERALKRIENNEGNLKRAESSLERAEVRIEVANEKWFI